MAACSQVPGQVRGGGGGALGRAVRVRGQDWHPRETQAAAHSTWSQQ